MTTLPDSANVIIVGGGIIGCSIAYHLVQRGVSDVLLLEQNQLTAGTTWHAAGLVGQLRATQNLTRLARYTTELFTELEQQTGQATGYRRTGSLSVATNADRYEELMRQASTARAFDIDVATVSAAEIADYWPGVRHDDLHGGVYLPGDGQTNPVDTTRALAAGARQGGATIIENIAVTDFVREHQHITGVITEQGEVSARQVVLAAGMWTRQLAALLGAAVPLQAAEHFYIVTEPLAELTPGMPTLRIPDEFAYFKEDAGKLLLGAFEPVAKPWSPEGVPRDFAFGTLPEDLDHFAPILEMAAARYPALADAGIQMFFNGPESFTPDDRYLLGPLQDLDNVFVAAGFNSIGIQSSGGAGKVLADWITDGMPPMDLWDVDIRRTFAFQANRDYLVDRTRETLGLLYAMHWPYRQYETARGARRSALHEPMLRAGAVMGELAGWERPNWFARGNTSRDYQYSYQAQNWFDSCGDECNAIANNVAIFDNASYPVFMVEGAGSVNALNYICAAEVDVAVGQVVYSQWLNERGGIEADVTVTRTGTEQFMIVSSCAQEQRDFAWLQRQLADWPQVHSYNTGSSTTMIAIMGPNSQRLLQAVSASDVSDAALPYYQSCELEIGYARVRANRLSYVGELGYELYVPGEFAAHVYERLLAAGKALELTHAGFHAMNACRIEKGFRHFGHDIGDDIDPISAGLGFAVAMDKPDFMGKAALLARERPLVTRLVNVLIDLPQGPFIYHDEPIFCAGERVGISTSGTFGHRLQRPVGIACFNRRAGVSAAYLNENAFEIEVAGQRYPVIAQLRPFYDPSGARPEPPSETKVRFLQGFVKLAMLHRQLSDIDQFKGRYQRVRLILGDQLSLAHSWFSQNDPHTLYVIGEFHEEATYVRHHIQKLCAFFAAMETFATDLDRAGHHVMHLNLDVTHAQSLSDVIATVLKQTGAARFEYQRPDEYRLARTLKALQPDRTTVSSFDSEHFLLRDTDIAADFTPGKAMRMETFYRRMRVRHNILMNDDGKPLGGSWNYDEANRQKLNAQDLAQLPAPLLFANDVRPVLARIRRHNIATIGNEHTRLAWPTDRAQSVALLAFFCDACLPLFGTFQDAMTCASDHGWSLYHSRLSFSLNTKMLHPKEVIDAALAAFATRDDINLAQVEGFVRQILGWREFVRGIYWCNMPDYRHCNELDADRDLPQFYWDGETRMRCMREAISASLEESYAHHIQRLMVTGNFALLTGVHPDQVDAWYLGIYADAIEWVQLPNTRGMSQYADGGLLGSKPYAASGNYMNKMSDYCRHCEYDVRTKTGENACPLNSLYWRFMETHRERLASNPRTAMVYRNWDRQPDSARTAVLGYADQLLTRLDEL